MKQVLVTGGSGQLGGYVLEALTARFHGVSCDIVAKSGVDNTIVGSILDLVSMTAACKKIDCVLHLAAAPNVLSGTAKEIMETNVLGTWTVLEAARLAGVRRVVLCSSDSVMGNTTWPKHFWKPNELPVSELHPVRPSDPYGTSKLLAEEVGRSFASRGALEVLSLRPVFILFPSMIDEVQKRQRLQQDYRTSTASGLVPAGGGICWNHVDPRDVAEAFVQGINSPWSGYSSYYITAEQTLHPKPTLELMSDEFGGAVIPYNERYFMDRPFAPMFDSRAAKRDLDWRPGYDHRNAILGGKK